MAGAEVAPPADLDDVAARFRPLATDDERAAARAWLVDVWAEACARAPGVEDRVASGAVPSALAVRVVAGAVARLMHNPQRLRDFTADDVRFGIESGPGGGMLLTPDEVALLVGPQPDGFTGSWRYS